MGEGVDPASMCQRLLEKIAQSKQLMAITDPELLLLFEDWFEELEEEVETLIRKHGPFSVELLAQKLGLSERGATVLLSKLTRSGKV